NAEGHPAYLLGETSIFGWWYFFPVALGVKTPIAFLILLVIGLVLCWKRRRTAAYAFLPAVSLGILLPAMTSHVNIGIRHILPLYSLLSIIAGVALVRVAPWMWTGVRLAEPW